MGVRGFRVEVVSELTAGHWDDSVQKVDWLLWSFKGEGNIRITAVQVLEEGKEAVLRTRLDEKDVYESFPKDRLNGVAVHKILFKLTHIGFGIAGGCICAHAGASYLKVVLSIKFEIVFG